MPPHQTKMIVQDQIFLVNFNFVNLFKKQNIALKILLQFQLKRPASFQSIIRIGLQYNPSTIILQYIMSHDTAIIWN